MAGILDYFSEVAGMLGDPLAPTLPIAPASKKAIVAQTAPKKQAEVATNFYNVAASVLTNKGITQPDPIAQDVRDLSVAQLYEKHGSRATDLLRQYSEASSEFQRDRSAPTETIADSVVGVVQGVSQLAGIPAWGLGLVNDSAGVKAARIVNNISEGIGSFKSDGLKARTRANTAINAADIGDSIAQYEKDLKTSGSFVAGVKRIGRDVISSASNISDDSAVVTDIASQGIGSLVTAGPISKALGAVGNASVRGAMKVGIASPASTLVPKAMALGSRASVPLAIGLQEGGGTYQQTVSDALQTLADRTDLTEDQKMEMANQAGLQAAGIQGTVGALTGTIVSKFEADPFSRVTARSFASNLLREASEEGIQSGSAQLAQNDAIGDYVDPNRVLSEGVGEQIAAGAIGGIGAAGSVQAPSVAANAIIGTAKLPVTGTVAIAKAVGRAVMAPINANAERVAAENAAFVDSLAPESLEPVVETAPIDEVVPSRFDAVKSYATTILEKGRSAFDKMTAARELDDTIDIQSTLDVLENTETLTPEEQDTRSVLRQTVDATKSLYERASKAIGSKPITQEVLETPEGIRDVDNVIGLAQNAPEKANPEQNDMILFHADQGRLNLTPKQRTALRTSSALVRTNIAMLEKAEALGLGSANSNLVSKQVQIETDPEAPKKSIKSHMQGVASAYSAGDTELAAQRLAQLRLFAEHMSNKVFALNEALAQGKSNDRNSVPYQALGKGGVFFTQKAGMYLNPFAEGSVRLAQQVALDAEAVAIVTNSLADIFPDLGIEHIKMVPLDASLNGPAVDVVNKYRQQGKKVPDEVQEANSNQDQNQEKETVTKQDVTEIEISEAPVENAPEENKPDTEANNDKENIQVTDSVEPTEVDTVTKPVMEDIAPELKTKVSTIENVYPSLVGSNNLIHKGFTVPSEPRTRTIGTETPFQDVVSALKSANDLRKFIGVDELNRAYDDDTVKAYADYMKLGQSIGSKMNKRLADKLDDNIKSKIDEAQNWLEGKAFNILNDDFTYNPELQQTAILAGLQWFIKLGNPTRLEADVVSEIVGFEVTDIDPLINEISAGFGPTELARSLAAEIQKFWGLGSNPNVPVNQTQGLLEAVAKEILESIYELKGLELIEINIGGRTIDRYKPNESVRDEALDKFPNAIEKAVLVDPEEINYINQVPTKVADMQLRSTLVELTSQQKEAIAAEQKVPHYLDTNMVDIILHLDEANVMKLFGGGDTNRPLNVNHKKSLDGKNLTAQSAFRTFKRLYKEIQGVASITGKELDAVPVHYDYNFTSVNRMQMLGKDNPQSNKIMRELILPTFTTVDLTDANEYEKFSMGLAQALGVKVHNMSREAAIKSLGKKLNQFQNTLDILTNRLGGLDITSAQVDTMIEEAEGSMAPAMLHALMEYARYQSADEAGKKAFKTATYFEADGVANGVTNAMMLFPSGLFTKDWLKNVRRGGYFPGQPGMTLNIHRSSGGDNELDKYTVAANATTSFARDLLNKYRSNKLVGPQIRAVNSLMNQFMPGVKINDGQLEINRSATKNPLTITLYGSGAMGIAGNLSDEIISNIYSTMSEAAQRKELNPKLTDAQAMFGPDNITADAEYAEFLNNVKALTATHLTEKKGVLGSMPVGKTGYNGNDLTDFTFTREGMKAIQENILHAFVGPMVEAIKVTVGEDTLESTKLIQNQIQTWSLYGKFAYQRAYEQALEAGKYAKGDLLSPADEKKVIQKVKAMMPFVSTDNQNFLMGATQSTDIPTKEFGRSLSGGFRTNAYLYGPGDAGVSGVPFMTIGSGDGQMMQYLSTNPNTPEGRLTIFDGVHSSASQLDDMGLIANESAFKAWENNPLGSVTSAFNIFVEKLEPIGLSELELKQLIRSLYPQEMWNSSISEETIIERMKDFAAEGIQAGKRAELRHKVISKVAASIDQMAGAGSPYQTTGVDLSNVHPDEIWSVMNTMLLEIENVTEEEPKTEPVANIPNVALETIVEKIKTDRLTKSLLRDVTRSMSVAGWQVVNTTRDEVFSILGSKGLSPNEAKKRANAKGFTTYNDQTIYVVDGEPETVLHELIHAATFSKVLAHYEGTTNEAVTRLEGLMEQFKALNLTDKSYQDAMDEMEYRASRMSDPEAVRKAAELNEFMAWALSNADLQNELKQVKVENKLFRLARSVIREIKAVLWGGKRSAAVKDDLFTNIRFNTNILMRTQASTAQVVGEGMLFHDPNTVENNRLNRINEKMKSRVADFINNTDVINKTLLNVRRKELLTKGARIANAMQASGFPMNSNEQVTFINLVAILGTNIDFNSNAASRLQELYRHVIKNISVESFMDNPEADDPNDRYHAAQQFNAVVGKFIAQNDTQGRSFLLPSFLALAMVSDDLRKVLAKVPMPKGEYAPWNSVDNILDNVGEGMMSNMSRLMSSDRSSKDLKDALDAMTDSLLQTAEERELFIEKYTNPVGGLIDNMNEVMQSGMTSLSNNILERTQNIKSNTKNPVIKSAANIAEIVAGVINEQNAQLVSEGVISGINRMKIPQMLYDLMNDLVGRTKSSASINELIKTASAWGQQLRQQFREYLPTILEKQFTRPVTDEEWSVMHRSLAQTDLVALRQSKTMTEIMDLVLDESLRAQEIERLEVLVGTLDPDNASLLGRKMKQLAHYMMTKEAGSNLLRNADAIAHLLGEEVQAAPTTELVQAIDQLVSLYAYELTDPVVKKSLVSLVQEQRQGVSFVASYLQGLRSDEGTNRTGNARFNSYKGYVPSENSGKGSLVVVDRKNPEQQDMQNLLEKSYVYLGSYNGSGREPRNPDKVYMYSAVPTRSAFAQGIIQNVQKTANGVHQDTGFSMNLNAGQITSPKVVARIAANKGAEGKESLIPLYDKDGKLYAYERSIDPKMLTYIEQDTNLSKMMGVWAGRQVEEAKAFELNKVLIDRLRDMYDEDRKTGRQVEYVDVFKSGDVITADAASIISDEVRAYIAKRFPKGFMVRKDLLNDSLGYRVASIGDVWTGNSRWSEETQKNIKNILIRLFGNDAYRYVLTGEKLLQNVISDVKTTIVIRSIVVPIANAAANVLQLVARGVPMAHIMRGIPQKTAEIEGYVKSRHRQMEAEAELAATTDPIRERKLKSEIQSIKDAHSRLSIWPLLQAGEFSAISDAGSRDDVLLTEGRLSDYIGNLIDKLPPGVRTVGKYATVSKDTALFRGLQKAVEYGDFVAKAILYDDLTKRQGKSGENGLTNITEEFVNYDRLPGRSRGYLESIGMMWFWNFKVRSTKVAMSMIRNNPVHASLAMMMPLPSVVGNIGMPLDDNFWMALFDGRLMNSVGFGIGLRAPGLLPISEVLG